MMAFIIEGLLHHACSCTSLIIFLVCAQSYVQVVPGSHTPDHYDPVASLVGNGKVMTSVTNGESEYLGELWTAQLVALFTCRLMRSDGTVRKCSLALVQWLEDVPERQQLPSRLARLQGVDPLRGYDVPHVDVIETDRFIKPVFPVLAGEQRDVLKHLDSTRDFGTHPPRHNEMFHLMSHWDGMGHRWVLDPKQIREWD
jgi:hypothetical protein